MVHKFWHVCTVKPRFTGPHEGKELSPVNREAWYIGVHFTLICTLSLFSGDRIEARSIEGPGKLGHGKSGFYCSS